jgi:hypothetical protein
MVTWQSYWRCALSHGAMLLCGLPCVFGFSSCASPIVATAHVVTFRIVVAVFGAKVAVARALWV